MAVGVGGCTTTLKPPASPVDPTRVLVLDHGYHSSLVLPSGRGGVVRYAYGDWRYFALDRQGFVNGVRALAWPTTGALGRRSLAAPLEADALARAVPPIQTSLCLTADRDAVAGLRRRLNERFTARRDQLVTAPRFALDFVPDPRDYSVFQNSNHVVAGWLEELNVGVNGWPVYARWRSPQPGEACG